MKILFVCTSLEPGRDGVGDYARLLASGCADEGHTCALLALNDPHLAAPLVSEFQSIRSHAFPALRLAADSSWASRFVEAQAFVESHAPDWLSWQLVPYGFHPKGIIPNDVFAFTALSQGRHTHVLLHELWIGLSAGESLKNRVYGFLQRRALLQFLSCLPSVAIDTTNPAYRVTLIAHGCAPEILPLCGNIPVEPAPPPRSDLQWIGGLFGTIHAQLTPRPCIDALAAGAASSGRQLRLLAFGRLGAHGDKLLAQLKNDYADRVPIDILGEKPPAEVSRIFHSMDFGIGTHPWALIGKSGAVAAMLDHGLPVIVPRDDWFLREPPTPPPLPDPLVVRLADTPSELMAGWLARRRPAQSRLPALAAAFLSRLNRADSPASLQQ